MFRGIQTCRRGCLYPCELNAQRAVRSAGCMRKTHGLVLEGETQLTSKTFHGKGCKDRMVRLGPDLSFFALAENPKFEYVSLGPSNFSRCYHLVSLARNFTRQ